MGRMTNFYRKLSGLSHTALNILIWGLCDSAHNTNYAPKKKKKSSVLFHCLVVHWNEGIHRVIIIIRDYWLSILYVTDSLSGPVASQDSAWCKAFHYPCFLSLNMLHKTIYSTCFLIEIYPSIEVEQDPDIAESSSLNIGSIW